MSLFGPRVDKRRLRILRYIADAGEHCGRLSAAATAAAKAGDDDHQIDLERRHHKALEEAVDYKRLLREHDVGLRVKLPCDLAD